MKSCSWTQILIYNMKSRQNIQQILLCSWKCIKIWECWKNFTMQLIVFYCKVFQKFSNLQIWRNAFQNWYMCSYFHQKPTFGTESGFCILKMFYISLIINKIFQLNENTDSKLEKEWLVRGNVTRFENVEKTWRYNSFSFIVKFF